MRHLIAICIALSSITFACAQRVVRIGTVTYQEGSPSIVTVPVLFSGFTDVAAVYTQMRTRPFEDLTYHDHYVEDGVSAIGSYNPPFGQFGMSIVQDEHLVLPRQSGTIVVAEIENINLNGLAPGTVVPITLTVEGTDVDYNFLEFTVVSGSFRVPFPSGLVLR